MTRRTRLNAATTVADVARGRTGSGQTGIYVPGDWGANWRAKLAAAKAGTGLAKIAVKGDSISFGAFVSNLDTKSYAGLLATSLQALYGDGGSGFKGAHRTTTFAGIVAPSQAITAWTAAGNIITQTGGALTSGTDQGPGSIRVGSTTAGDTLTATFRGTTLKIYTRVNNGTSAPWTYSIDGGSAVSVTDTSTNAFNEVAVKTITGLSAGSHTVVITHGSGSANLAFFGIEGSNASGVLVNNYASSGAPSDRYAINAADPINPGTWSGGSMNPCDLLIYALGANDVNASGYTTATGITLGASAVATATTLTTSAYLAPGQYQIDSEMVYVIASNGTTATLKYALTAGHSSGASIKVPLINPDSWLTSAARNFSDLRNTNANAELLILLPHIGNFDGLQNWAVITQRARALAEAYGAALVDVWPMGRNSWSYWNTLGRWGNGAATTAGSAGTDNIHPSDAGHQAYADALLPLLVA